MAIINLLSPSESRKIAAGESIERPAHIVKELLENALDAGATSISVHIKQAGKQQIRIIDNGCGMDEVDAQLCFQPHATSKITTVNDLEAISTYGFRGEALASVAAVSKVMLRTKQASSQTGVLISYTEDKLIHKETIACPIGTELVVEDLFYNMPARKKFLKQDETEWNAIGQVVDAFCLSHPEVHFKLFHNEKNALSAPPVATAKDRAAQAWGSDIAQALLPLNYVDDRTGIAIQGFTSNHQFWRYGKTNMYFFINNRWIKNSELSKAVLKGYLGVLPDGRFPAAILFLTLNQAEIDVNIHPKKEEVRFSKPGLIATAITNAVKATLSDHTNSHFTRRIEPENISDSMRPPHSQTVPTFTAGPYNAAPLEKEPSQADFIPLEFFNWAPAFASTKTQIANSTQPQDASFVPIPDLGVTAKPYQLLGQILQTYILCAHNDDLIIIDQHAAHERILYEKRTHYFDKAQGTQLLFPEVVTLNQALVEHLITEQAFFSQQGIIFDALGTHEVVVRAAPPQLRGPSLKEVITDAAHFIAQHGSLDRSVFSSKFNEHMHSHMACKAAIRAGHQLTTEEMTALINDLMSVENRFICVHGRPTLWTISKAEIEKKFRRS